MSDKNKPKYIELLFNEMKSRPWMIGKQEKNIIISEYIRELERYNKYYMNSYPPFYHYKPSILDKYKDSYIATWPLAIDLSNGSTQMVQAFLFQPSNDLLLRASFYPKNEEPTVCFDVTSSSIMEFINFVEENNSFMVPDDTPRTMAFGQ